nr:hypothetical protein [uncultured Brevundimonas sp.]
MLGQLGGIVRERASVVPSIDTRLRSVAKAIEQVIIPALPTDQRLAIEQAEIAIGHLKVLETQWRHIPQVARLELRYLAELADALLAATEGPADDDLVRARDAARLVDHADFEALSSATRALGMAVERFIDVGEGLLTNGSARAAILDHARLQARLERSWFAASGISNTTDVPALADLLAAE